MFTRATLHLLAALAVLLISCSKEQQAAKDTSVKQATPDKAGSASTPKDTTLAGRYFDRAEEFFKTEALYDSAIAYFGKAGALYENEQNWERRVRCYHRMGRSFREQGEFDQAMKYLEQALADGLKELGEQHAEVAAIYSTIGIVYRSKGDYARALDFANQALSIQLATLGENDPAVGSTYNRIANVYSEKNDLDQALAFREKALAIYIAAYGERSAEAASYYNNIGNDYLSRGDYDQALFFHKKSLEMKQAFQGRRHQVVAWSYDNLGQVYYKKSDYERARECYENALSIWRETIGAENFFPTMSYDHLVELNRSTGDYAPALAFAKKSLSIKRRILGERHPSIADTYNLMGQVYFDQGDYATALDCYQNALRANVPAFADSNPSVNPPLAGILGEPQLLESFSGKARTLAARYARKTQALHDLEMAAATYRHASQLIDQMRHGYKAEGSKLFLVEKATDIYDHAILTTLRLHQITQKEEHKNTAFLLAEKSKAGVMLEALSDAEAKRFAGISDRLLEKERQLRIDLAFYEKSLTEEQLKREDKDSAKIALWQDKVFGLKQVYDALLQRFEKEYPDYYNLKYQTQTIAVPEVQQRLLDDRTALVEYFTGKDSIFIFAITKNDFTIKTSAKDSLFAPQIEQLRQGIIKQDFAPYAQAAFRLYQTLLAPITSILEGKNLILVPDGLLSAIPFEALLTQAVNPAGELKDYLRLPYLVEAHAMSYAYSATLLQQLQSRKNREAKHDYLAFAPLFPEGLPAGTRGADFVKENLAADSLDTERRLRSFLPATKTEVTGIFARFENSYGLFERWFGNKSRVYLEQEAKEEKLKSPDLSSYRFLHFATHGLVNEKNPKLSGLILTQEDTTSKEDGILHLGEIYNLNLNADLVVLSACETGLGQIAHGEGIIGLTRGFLYAGASNVLVSLWQVSDMTTSDLMMDFYDKMLGGMSKAEALREAKLQMIRRDPGYAKPYYWAPFILVGR
jgi:CHAT domain-containing protein/Tfp pilus assembly protein PilF